MGGKLLRMAWGRYQNRQAGQQGAFAAAAAAAAATAGVGGMPGMGLMLEQATGGYLLPGMLGAHETSTPVTQNPVRTTAL